MISCNYSYMVSIATPVCLSVCGSVLRYPIAYSLLVGEVPYPEHRLNLSIDSVSMFRFLCFLLAMVWSLPFPPSKIHPGSLISKTSCPSPLSFRPNCLLFARFYVFSRPPPASGHDSPLPEIGRASCRGEST